MLNARLAGRGGLSSIVGAGGLGSPQPSEPSGGKVKLHLLPHARQELGGGRWERDFAHLTEILWQREPGLLEIKGLNRKNRPQGGTGFMRSWLRRNGEVRLRLRTDAIRRTPLRSTSFSNVASTPITRNVWRPVSGSRRDGFHPVALTAMRSERFLAMRSPAFLFFVVLPRFGPFFRLTRER